HEQTLYHAGQPIVSRWFGLDDNQFSAKYAAAGSRTQTRRANPHLHFLITRGCRGRDHNGTAGRVRGYQLQQLGGTLRVLNIRTRDQVESAGSHYGFGLWLLGLALPESSQF